MKSTLIVALYLLSSSLVAMETGNPSKTRARRLSRVLALKQDATRDNKRTKAGFSKMDFEERYPESQKQEHDTLPADTELKEILDTSRLIKAVEAAIVAHLVTRQPVQP